MKVRVLGEMRVRASPLTMAWRSTPQAWPKAPVQEWAWGFGCCGASEVAGEFCVGNAVTLTCLLFG